MPRDGSMTLSDVRGPTLAIVCETCGRRGHYRVQRLLAEHGDAKLTDLLVTLADRPKARSVSIHDRCRAVYEALSSSPHASARFPSGPDAKTYHGRGIAFCTAGGFPDLEQLTDEELIALDRMLKRAALPAQDQDGRYLPAR